MPRPDIRLIAADMDGTLLLPDGSLPEGFWPLLERLRESGIAFAPASGRQLATLRDMFGDADLDYIAENGAYVVRGGDEVSHDALAPEFVASLIARLRGLIADGVIRAGFVVCGKRSAYIEDAEPWFVAEVEKYYRALQIVDDVLEADDRVLKVAIYDVEGGADHTAPELADVAETHQVVVSGAHWIDVMNGGVNKGVALQNLQRMLGVTAAQTAAFGDFFNDVELLQAAEWSYAMANAHPDVVASARYRAPSNAEAGVLRVLESLLA